MNNETSGWLSPDGVFYGAVTINEGSNDEYTYNIGSDTFGGDINKVIEHTEEIKKLIDNSNKKDKK